MISTEIDPYKILGLTYEASEEAIQQAFHEKLRQHAGAQQYVTAYSMIRTAPDRQRFRWGNVFSCLHEATPEKREILDLEALIKELAFLSTWELGEEICLKKD